MDTEERSFPLTKLTAEIVALAKAAESNRKDRRAADPTVDEELK
jgi:hypothetical protein